MLVLIDESGDAGFKIARGSTPYFVVAMVIFRDFQDVREQGVECGEGFRGEVTGVVDQIFDGQIVVEDHLGLDGVLALSALAVLDEALGIESVVGVAFES